MRIFLSFETYSQNFEVKAWMFASHISRSSDSTWWYILFGNVAKPCSVIYVFQFATAVLRIMREILIAILLSSGMLLGSRTKTIKVVQFQNNFETSSNEIELNEQPTQSTNQITLCFRVMPRYHREYFLIYTEQLKIILKNEINGFTFFRNPANSSTATEYFRYYSLCEPRVPGIWSSMCFGMSFTRTTQLVRVFQEGQMCSERNYTGDFDLLYFPVSNSIEAM